MQQLGEHSIFHKETNFELGARVPLIIRAPDRPASHGQKTTAFAQLVDLYPTVSDLLGLGKPHANLSGQSLAPVFDAPGSASVNDYAFSQFPHCAHNATPYDGCDHQDTVYMGYSVRSPDWRCTLWFAWDKNTGCADWSTSPYATELYDHHGDDGTQFAAFENENVAASNPDIVAKHAAVLRAHFLPCVPKKPIVVSGLSGN